jgi:hypothetical protein
MKTIHWLGAGALSAGLIFASGCGRSDTTVSEREEIENPVPGVTETEREAYTGYITNQNEGFDVPSPTGRDDALRSGEGVGTEGRVDDEEIEPDAAETGRTGTTRSE